MLFRSAPAFIALDAGAIPAACYRMPVPIAPDFDDIDARAICRCWLQQYAWLPRKRHAVASREYLPRG